MGWIVKIKRVFCCHKYGLKAFTLGSENTNALSPYVTFYPTCTKCGHMVTNKPMTQWNPNFSIDQQDKK